MTLSVPSVNLGSYHTQTVAVVLTFLLAMVLHPEVFQKAQEEVDRVIKQDRLPNLDDRDSLPYLDCALKESYR